MAKNRDYWKRRFALLEETSHKDIARLLPDIDRIYKRAQVEIEKEIRAWYQRLADNNNISMSEARKLLSRDELKEFKWSVEEYIKRGEENAIDQRWMKQLENASAKFHISKLEALKLQTQQEIEKIYGNQLDMFDTSMRKLYQDSYYRTAFELQKGFRIGWPVAAIDQNKLHKLIQKPWAPDGKNFSDRIWENRTKLVNELHTELTRMCITGAGPDQAIKNIAKKMNTSCYNSSRLVMTEAAYFSSVSQKDCFNDLNVEQYEICATLDSRTSEICQEMDGKVFDMKDYEAGVTAPPFHVFCRSCTVPYFNDEFTVGELRAARGEDGKTYYVPADMTYKEWKQTTVTKDVPGFQSLCLNKAIYTQDELNTMAKDANRLIDQYTTKKTRWSGNIIMNPDGKNQKLWNCDLNLSDDTAPYIVIHELLHARSISYYDALIYRNNRVIEEATVELLSQIICRERGISIISSDYEEWTVALSKIGKLLGMDEKAFAKKVFETPPADRLGLLEDMASDIIGLSGSIGTYQKFNEQLKRLETQV